MKNQVNSEQDGIVPDQDHHDSTVTERLYHYIVELKHMRRGPFYDLTGVSNGTLDRKSGMTTDSIQKVLEHFPLLNINWLVQGHGDPETKLPSPDLLPKLKIKDYEELKERMTQRLEELNEVRKQLEDARKEIELLKNKPPKKYP